MNKSYLLRVGLTFLAVSGLARELMLNPSFETLDQNGLPMALGIPPNTVHIGAEIEVIRDVTRSKNGINAVRMTSPNAQGAVYFNLVERNADRLPPKMTVSFWAKGQGEVSFQTVSKSAQRRVIGVFTSEDVEINAAEWTRVEVPLELVQSGEADGVTQTIRTCSIRFRFQGDVTVDDFHIVEAGRAPAAEIAVYDGEIVFPMIGIAATPPGKVTIDGVMEDGEWDRASGVTGLYTLGGKLSARQTKFRFTWDSENLYVLVEAPYDSGLVTGTNARDFNIRECDVAEIYLNTGVDVHHILINPAGGILDSRNRDVTWTADIQHAATVIDSGETRGGVLTFSKGLWISEVAIPFSELGLQPPQEGDKWLFNVARDFFNSGKRTSEDWTTLVHNRSLSSPDNLATLVFYDEIPALRIEQFGAIGNGAVSIKGDLYSSAPVAVDVQAICLLDGTGNTLMNRSETFQLDGFAELTVNDKISSDRVIQAVMIIAAKDRNSGALFYQLPVRFESTSSFEYRAVYNMSDRSVVSSLDLRTVTDNPDNLSVRVAVKNGAGATVATGSLDGIDRVVVDLSVALQDAPPGEYVAECELLDASGSRLSMAVAEFAVVEWPEWLGSGIGIDERLPPPFIPVQASGNRVEVLMRSYLFADSGIPQQITAAGQNLFAKPPGLRCVMNGAPVESTFAALTVTEQDDGRVVYALKGMIGSVPVAGELTVEYDGFAEWTLTLPPTDGVTIDSLALDFFYSPERALYLRGANGENEKRFRMLLDAEETLAPESIGGFYYATGDFPWSNEFMHELFICDDERGFYVMNESSEFLIGPQRVEVEKSPDLITVTYNLVSEPYRLDKPLPYQLFWLATPVKSLPDDPKKWNMCFGGKTHEFSETTQEQLYVRMLHLTLPNLYNIIPKKEQALLERERDSARNIVPYWSIGAGPLGTEEFDRYDPEWEVLPVSAGAAGSRGGWKCACTRSRAWIDFEMHGVKKMVEEYGIDGVYLDVSRAQGCLNPVHGCGWFDPKQGRRIPTINIKDTREMYKRLYTYLKFSGKDRVVFLHGVNPASLGFCDVISQGESWLHERDKMYGRLTPDIYRAIVMRNMTGVPFESYMPFFSWRAIVSLKRDPIPADEAFMLGLPFYTRPCILGMFPSEIADFWQLTNPWWTQMDFIGYWRAESPLSLDSSEVVASTYRKHDGAQAMIGASNYSHEQQTVTLTIDETRLGFKIGSVQLVNPVGGAETTLPAANLITLTIPARSGRMVILKK
ncbi:MAG: DUF6067 family protein [Kiritimatiellales bacterium]|nr:DUF6067 family protein [Kiritimatiellales bacterium]